MTSCYWVWVSWRLQHTKRSRNLSEISCFTGPSPIKSGLSPAPCNCDCLEVCSPWWIASHVTSVVLDRLLARKTHMRRLYRGIVEPTTS